MWSARPSMKISPVELNTAHKIKYICPVDGHTAHKIKYICSVDIHTAHMEEIMFTEMLSGQGISKREVLSQNQFLIQGVTPSHPLNIINNWPHPAPSRTPTFVYRRQPIASFGQTALSLAYSELK